MGYGVQDTGGSFAQTKYMLILEAVRNMGKKYVECKGHEDIDGTNELYRSVEYGLNLVESALPLEIQQALESDRKKISEIEDLLDKDSKINDQQRKLNRAKLRYSYATNKMYYVHAGANELDIYKQTKEGELDFSYIDFETMKKIIKESSHSGLSAGLAQAEIKKKDG